jgi:membrane protease YdiL (CAAX protease family)
VSPSLRRGLLAAALLGWGAVLTRFGSPDLYALLAGYAGALTIVLLGIDPDTRALFRVDRRGLLVGVAGAGLMIVGTHLAFAVVSALEPRVSDAVQANYATTGIAGNWTVVPLMLVVVLAEEVLWRGSLIEALRGVVSPPAGAAISIASYALVQLASGSWVVVALAAVCGALWTLERLWTRSLVPPLITHAAWSLTVLVVAPVG